MSSSSSQSEDTKTLLQDPLVANVGHLVPEHDAAHVSHLPIPNSRNDAVVAPKACIYRYYRLIVKTRINLQNKLELEILLVFLGEGEKFGAAAEGLVCDLTLLQTT
jgi:hypothetical protein